VIQTILRAHKQHKRIKVYVTGKCLFHTCCALLIKSQRLDPDV
jgi:hypothetical protein